MKSQWESVLENLGDWRGSFTQLSPQGQLKADIPTAVRLEGHNENQMIRHFVCRYGPEVDTRASLEGITPVDEKVLEYSTLGRGVLVFESGAFSQGVIQYGPFSEFGAELGLLADHHRLRLVQLFDSTGQLTQLTLIREHLAGTEPSHRPPLTLEALIGTWQGEAVTLYPDWRSPDTYPTQLRVERECDRVLQQLTYGEGSAARTLASSGTVTENCIYFDQGPLRVQVLLLPDGASSNCPLALQPRQSFVLEVGWLIQPDLRQRMIRRYSEKGEWSSLTLVTEHKVA